MMVCRETEKRHIEGQTSLEKKLLSSVWKFLNHSREGSVGKINTESQNVRSDRYPQRLSIQFLHMGKKETEVQKSE